jgi:hypothetical protein
MWLFGSGSAFVQQPISRQLAVIFASTCDWTRLVVACGWGVLRCLLQMRPPWQTSCAGGGKPLTSHSWGVGCGGSPGTAERGGVWHASGVGPLGRRSCKHLDAVPACWVAQVAVLHACSAQCWGMGSRSGGAGYEQPGERVASRCVCAHTEVCPSSGALTLCELCCLLGCIGLCCWCTCVFPFVAQPLSAPFVVAAAVPVQRSLCASSLAVAAHFWWGTKGTRPVVLTLRLACVQIACLCVPHTLTPVCC